MTEFRGTTICAVKRDGVTAIAGDGQVTMGENVIMKNTARKVRRIYNGNVVIGFAGSVSDAFALSEKFEASLTQYSGNLEKAAVELAQGWRMNREARSLEALLIAADKDTLLLISGTGEVILPDEGVLAIGSGGNYALAAARALVENTPLTAPEIADKALHIAASICVFTNDHIIVEVV
ncbi:MAG: ATP-dependent protease subunit HslV [Clostridia bacterium]|nr:ATP-dependent protease subunit HslV [Clostridia bacterium]MCR4577640.1 ATP-dependent protease subunit HslV [Clostridiales bacterium]